VVVVLDRESRDVAATDFEAEVRAELMTLLVEKGRGRARLEVVAADRAFEAWILADAQGLHERKKFKLAPDFHCFEGSLGIKREKGKREIERLLGRPYSETNDGPKLFESIDPSAAREWKNWDGAHGASTGFSHISGSEL